MADENEQIAPQPLPESASVDDAAELMAGLDQPQPEEEPATEQEPAPEPEPEPEAEADPSEDLRTGPSGDLRTGPSEGAPEFWSAEDKAAWASVPAELKPVLARYEQQRIAYVNEKAREAADKVRTAEERARSANDTVDQAAAWWQQAGPALQRAFADKWAAVNWAELAEKSPAEWARLNQLRLDEAALLAEAERRGEADLEAATRHAAAAFQAAQEAEHAKLAAKLPDYFGTSELAARTYGELGRFLLAKGIPADRINAVYEAPIIELALSAMRFEEAQKKISAVTATASTTGSATPTRVQPGPPSRAGNRASEAARQVSERFHRTGDVGDAARLIEALRL